KKSFLQDVAAVKEAAITSIFKTFTAFIISLLKPNISSQINNSLLRIELTTLTAAFRVEIFHFCYCKHIECIAVKPDTFYPRTCYKTVSKIVSQLHIL